MFNDILMVMYAVINKHTNYSVHVRDYLVMHQSSKHMSRVKRICVFEHSVMTNFNCVCTAIQRRQGSGFLSEGSSWLTVCMSEQRRFWRDCADASIVIKSEYWVIKSEYRVIKSEYRVEKKRVSRYKKRVSSYKSRISSHEKRVSSYKIADRML